MGPNWRRKRSVMECSTTHLAVSPFIGMKIAEGGERVNCRAAEGLRDRGRREARGFCKCKGSGAKTESRGKCFPFDNKRKTLSSG